MDEEHQSNVCPINSVVSRPTQDQTTLGGLCCALEQRILGLLSIQRHLLDGIANRQQQFNNYGNFTLPILITSPVSVVQGLYKYAKLPGITYPRFCQFENKDSKPTNQQPSLNTKVDFMNPDQKRSGYLTWDDYFMAVAFLSAQRSKDPVTQVGACIVNEEKRIVGVGYNGMPNRCSDDTLPWGKGAERGLDTKHPYVCHAEMNAIVNKNSSWDKNCKIYVSLFPCNECAKIIIQSDIKEVVYCSDEKKEKDSMKASRILFDLAGVTCRPHIPKQDKIVIDFNCINQS